MEIFSALLALCAENSPVTGEFPTQRPVTRSFDVFVDVCRNKRLNKQSWGWWFETLSRSLWRQCNGVNWPMFKYSESQQRANIGHKFWDVPVVFTHWYKFCGICCHARNELVKLIFPLAWRASSLLCMSWTITQQLQKSASLIIPFVAKTEIQSRGPFY